MGIWGYPDPALQHAHNTGNNKFKRWGRHKNRGDKQSLYQARDRFIELCPSSNTGPVFLPAIPDVLADV